MNRSRISWLVNADGTPGYTWSPMTGCGPGLPCYDRCWARAYHVRYRGGDFSVKLHPEKLDEPLRLRKPSTIGVCLMGDLLHRDVPAAFIGLVLYQIRMADRHTFVLLTKRIERLQKMLARHEPEPPRNLWIGTSVEDQATADERIPILLDTPAAHRWVSLEPQIGVVDLREYLPPNDGNVFAKEALRNGACPHRLDLVIQGCESGPRRRPFDLQWARDVRDQCKAAGVCYALKQIQQCMNDECHAWGMDNGCGMETTCESGRKNTVIEKPGLDGDAAWSLPWSHQAEGRGT